MTNPRVVFAGTPDFALASLRALVDDVLAAAGLAPADARAIAAALMQSTLASAVDLGPTAALSGPVLRGDAATNHARAVAVGVSVEGTRWRAPRRGVIVDAIFGTGLSRAVDKAPAASVRRIRASRGSAPRGRVVSVTTSDCAARSASCGHSPRSSGSARWPTRSMRARFSRR